MKEQVFANVWDAIADSPAEAAELSRAASALRLVM